jgi:hypothetical protein
MNAHDWQPIETVPRNTRVELFLENGENRNGEIAIGMICVEERQPIDHYWTWGGPYSGSDIKWAADALAAIATRPRRLGIRITPDRKDPDLSVILIAAGGSVSKGHHCLCSCR